jgi:hypothetical protein
MDMLMTFEKVLIYIPNYEKVLIYIPNYPKSSK